MKKLIFLEGLPGVGKTTLIKKIEQLYPFVNTVDELIKVPIPHYKTQNEFWFMQNDDKKISTHSSGIIVIDRGPISTLSYCQTRFITDSAFNFDMARVRDWFFNYIDLLNSPNTYIYYLTNNQQKFNLTTPDSADPYGSIENQKILELITIKNIKKYAKNAIIKEYYQNNYEEIINEIIN